MGKDQSEVYEKHAKKLEIRSGTSCVPKRAHDERP